ncbi:right-handed parallel beta-helix repeat-containing protein [Paenibacillus planticolens]|uniref:right-handed parallel beta-helix repeat-containing protein n=1 Tax=Paenibacillus planticolens TaxID=2654976 RepID=UPI0014925DBC|nr:right-handed parallel beta-helix repeat-containing protein [Paenibacillus planticolens]
MNENNDKQREGALADLNPSHQDQSSPSFSRRKLLSSLGAAGLALAAGDLFSNSSTAQAAVPSSTLIYNVKDFGASGNRRYDEDDAPYIQSAIDTAAASGGIVFIPPGMYSLKLPLRVSSNVTIMGAGSNSILRSFANKFGLFNLTAVQHVRIQSLAFQGTGSYGGSSIPIAESGISLIQATDIHISDCTFSMIDNGVKSQDSSRVTIESCLFDSLIGALDYDTQGFGIWCSNGADHQIVHNQFSTMFQSPIFLTNGSRQCYIARNRMQKCFQSGIELLSKPKEKPCSFNTISDNIMEAFANSSGSTGYTFGVRLRGNCVSNSIMNNIMSEIDDVGIQLIGSADVKLERPRCNHISHNQLANIGDSAIVLINAYDNRVGQNIVRDVKIDGIRIASNGKESGSYSDRNHLAGNSLIRCNKAPIRIADANCRETVLFGNLGSNNGDKVIDKGTDSATSSL